MSNFNKKIKIRWSDARLFSPQQKEIGISLMETRGAIAFENDDYLIVQNPTTINTNTNQPHPKESPTFYLIPKVMIQSVENLD
jgi:hypothetical protein